MSENISYFGIGIACWIAVSVATCGHMIAAEVSLDEIKKEVEYISRKVDGIQNRVNENAFRATRIIERTDCEKGIEEKVNSPLPTPVPVEGANKELYAIDGRLYSCKPFEDKD